MHIYIYTVLADPTYIRCACSNSGREITKYTAIYSAYIRLWPSLPVYSVCGIHGRESTKYTAIYSA